MAAPAGTTLGPTTRGGDVMVGAGVHFNAANAGYAIKTGAGLLRSITVGTPAAGTMTLYDNTSATGTPILVVTYIAATQPFTITPDQSFTTGLFAVVTGSADVVVSYY